MLDRIADVVSRRPWRIIIGFLIVTAFFVSYVRKIEIEPGFKSMLPKDMEAIVVVDRIEEIFGGTDMLMVALTTDDVLKPETLRRVKTLTRKIERVPQVDKVISLFTAKDIRSESGEMIVDPAVRRIPRNEEQREALRETLRRNDLVYGQIVSKDFTAVAILALLEPGAQDEALVAAVEKIVEETPGSEEVVLGGMPFVRTRIGIDIQQDLARFFPYGLLVMLIFLFLCFRRLRGVLLPFGIVLLSIFFALGLIPLFGWKFQIMTVILPVTMIAVANDYGIHLFAHYQELNRPGSDRTPRELAREIIRRLGKPVLVTALTTIVGFLSLLSHIIVPAKQLGVLAAAGIAYALIGSLLFIPAVLALLPKDRPIHGIGEPAEKAPFLERLLHRNARLVTGHPKRVLIASLVLVALFSTGLKDIIVDTNPDHYYSEDAPVPRASQLMNEKFGGSTNVAVVAEGDIKDPAVLRQIEDLETYLNDLPQVGNTTSIAQVVRRMNRVMNDDDPKFETIPDSRDAVAQYFLLYSMNGDPDDFDRLVDFPYKHALITARINSLSTRDLSLVVDAVKEYTHEDPDTPFTMVGGFARVFADLVTAMVRGQIASLLLSLVLVSTLVMVLFRSFWAGIFASLPIAMAMVVLFGLMGHFGIELNTVTTLLSSIMIGVGIDYTIHYLWRYREERQSGKDPVAAMRTTLTTTGRGIVFNALSVVVGFLVLMLSTFLPVQFFGFLIVVSISTCLVGALVLLPALCLLTRPRFLEPISAKGTN